MSTSQAAPSMGSAIGAAISLTIFTSFLGEGVTIVGEVLHTQGMQENAAIRQAGLVTFMFNLIPGAHRHHLDYPHHPQRQEVLRLMASR